MTACVSLLDPSLHPVHGYPSAMTETTGTLSKAEYAQFEKIVANFSDAYAAADSPLWERILSRLIFFESRRILKSAGVELDSTYCPKLSFAKNPRSQHYCKLVLFCNIHSRSQAISLIGKEKKVFPTSNLLNLGNFFPLDKTLLPHFHCPSCHSTGTCSYLSCSRPQSNFSWSFSQRPLAAPPPLGPQTPIDIIVELKQPANYYGIKRLSSKPGFEVLSIRLNHRGDPFIPSHFLRVVPPTLDDPSFLSATTRLNKTLDPKWITIRRSQQPQMVYWRLKTTPAMSVHPRNPNPPLQIRKSPSSAPHPRRSPRIRFPSRLRVQLSSPPRNNA
jgi:hypothetical protein